MSLHMPGKKGFSYPTSRDIDQNHENVSVIINILKEFCRK